MGFTPSEIDKMSLWEFLACRDGWNIAQGGKPPSDGGDDFSVEELRELGIEGF